MFRVVSGPHAAPPVLALHGGGVAGWMWNSLRARLAGHYRVIVPDLPGHGRSADEPYVSHRQTVTALAAMLETTSPGRPASVIGFSLGAQLAILLASERPDLVQRVMVISAQAKAMRCAGLALGALSVSAPLARRSWFARLQARHPPAASAVVR